MKLISVKEASEILGKSPQQIALDIRFKKVPAIKVGRAWVLKLEDVKKFKEETQK